MRPRISLSLSVRSSGNVLVKFVKLSVSNLTLNTYLHDTKAMNINLITPVLKKIDPLKWRKNARKDQNGIVRKQKISRHTTAIQSFFRQKNYFHFFTVFFLHVSGSIFFRTGVIYLPNKDCSESPWSVWAVTNGNDRRTIQLKADVRHESQLHESIACRCYWALTPHFSSFHSWHSC